MSNGQGVHFAASDPRKDGAADPQGAPIGPRPGSAPRAAKSKK